MNATLKQHYLILKRWCSRVQTTQNIICLPGNQGYSLLFRNENLSTYISIHCYQQPIGIPIAVLLYIDYCIGTYIGSNTNSLFASGQGKQMCTCVSIIIRYVYLQNYTLSVCVYCISINFLNAHQQQENYNIRIQKEPESSVLDVSGDYVLTSSIITLSKFV